MKQKRAECSIENIKYHQVIGMMLTNPVSCEEVGGGGGGGGLCGGGGMQLRDVILTSRV